MEFGMNYVRKILKWLTKWKVVDTEKYRIVNKNRFVFVLTPKQQVNVERLQKEKGNMDFCFYPTEYGDGFKVKIWNTDEWIDLSC
jgi:hypothetical protein